VPVPIRILRLSMCRAIHAATFRSSFLTFGYHAPVRDEIRVHLPESQGC
jgi:hypothetical protein